jgi:uncharacterized membrane-anchored protein YhcB (DUF1043 family)
MEMKTRDVALEQLRSNIAELERHRERLHVELSSNKDTLASKQSQMSELLAELADTRQKLSHMSTLYQKQQARLKDVEKQLVVAQQQQQHSGAEPSASASAAGIESGSTAAAPPPYQEAIAAKRQSSLPSQATPMVPDMDLVSFDEPTASSAAPIPSSQSSMSSGSDLLSFDESSAAASVAASAPVSITPSSILDQSPMDDIGIGIGTGSAAASVPPSSSPSVDVMFGSPSSPSDTSSLLSSSFPLPEMLQTPSITVGTAGAPKWQMVVMDETGKQTDVRLLIPH